MPPLVNGESASFAALNRNKRSLVLDLKQAEAQAIVLELAKNCDVFLENNRPGVLESLGLGADDLKRVKPNIVYTSVSGFGQTGPDRKRAGVNLIIEAFSGTLSVTGRPNEMPIRPGIQTADIFGAMFATYATLCGLISVLQNRGGRTIDVSLVEASIAAAAWETASFLATGEVPERMGDRHRLNAPYQLFETSDHQYLAIGTPNDQLFERLMVNLGLQEYLQDPRFISYVLRKQNESDLLELVSPAIQSFDASSLETLLRQAGVPCARMNNIKEVFQDPHIIDRKVAVQIHHPVMGDMQAVRNPVLMREGSPTIRRHAPMLGEHSREILSGLGKSDEDIQSLAAKGVVLLHQ